jgi:hypothetical protein
MLAANRCDEDISDGRLMVRAARRRVGTKRRQVAGADQIHDRRLDQDFGCCVCGTKAGRFAGSR